MIWLIGYKGMLGTAVSELLKKQEKPYMVSDQEIDITNIDRLNEFTENKSISWIINCAAYTAVDKAEDEKELAFKINAEGPFNIAQMDNGDRFKPVSIIPISSEQYPTRAKRPPNSYLSKDKICRTTWGTDLKSVPLPLNP